MQNKLKILISTDYSPAAVNAELYAIKFANATRSTLEFVHVFDPVLEGTAIGFDAEKIEYNPLQFETNKLQEHVTALIQSLNISPLELDHSCIVREGNLVRKHILQEVAESGIDIIIAGTHGASALHELLLGSHTWDIAKCSRVPVLAIPENAVFNGIKHIVYAADYRENEPGAIDFMSHFADKLNAVLTVLHVANYAVSEKFARMRFENFRKMVNDRVTSNKLTLQLIQNNNVTDGLNEFCSREKADWLVMFPRRFSMADRIFTDPILHPIGRSATKRQSFHSNTPLFILPEFSDGVCMI
jgi:nucleotide-binding universal stress UspA family protein